MAASHPPFVNVPEEERAPLAELDRLLAATAAPASLRLLLGERVVVLPEAVTPLIHALVHALARGNAVTVTPAAATLTIPQAADLLHVSQPSLVRLLDDGALPTTWEGEQCRVRLDDLFAYRARRAAGRDAGLDRLVALSEALGLYDD